MSISDQKEISRPIIAATQIDAPDNLDLEALAAKRGSILGMAMTGVRNLLAVSDH